MSDSKDPKESAWDRFARELTSPWDWVAAGLGAVGGAGATIILHGGDLGSSIGAGAIGAVTARKAAAASLVGRNLRKRMDSVEKVLETIKDEKLCRRLRTELEGDFRLWSTKGISNGEFEKTLDGITDEIRRYWRRDEEEPSPRFTRAIDLS